MPLRVRTSVAALCIALAICTAFTPALVPDCADALLIPVWQYQPPASVVEDLRSRPNIVRLGLIC